MIPELNKIHHGDVLAVLRSWPDEFVQTVVTSPPYWGLRDYGVAGQLGLEKTPAQFVSKMVAVFREIRRVLKKDGTLWLNLGDSYATDTKWGGQSGSKNGDQGGGARRERKLSSGLKPKDMVGIPWRVAFALQDDGWWLRSDIIWAKPNPMPESVTDRPTKSHEYLFLLTKSDQYFYDAAAIRTVAKNPSDDVRRLASVDFFDKSHPDKMRNGLRAQKMPDGWATHKGAHGSFHRDGREKGKTDKQRGHSRRHDGFNDRWDEMEKTQQIANGANARTVWSIATHPFPDAHFATFPLEIPRRCIMAGSRTGGGRHCSRSIYGRGDHRAGSEAIETVMAGDRTQSGVCRHG